MTPTITHPFRATAILVLSILLVACESATDPVAIIDSIVDTTPDTTDAKAIPI